MSAFLNTDHPIVDKQGRAKQHFLKLLMKTSITIPPATSAPTNPIDGMTVLADGTKWNPGAGQGIYSFYASAWHKLG